MEQIIRLFAWLKVLFPASDKSERITNTVFRVIELEKLPRVRYALLPVFVWMSVKKKETQGTKQYKNK